MGKSEREPVSGFWWLLRLVCVMVVALVVVAGAWYAWWRHARAKMDEAVAAIRAKGEIVTWDQVEIRDVPDPENAAFYYKRASASLTPGVVANRSSAATGSSAWRSAANVNVPANQAALDLVKKARPCTQATWVPPQAGLARTPPNWPPIPVYANMSNLSRLIRDEAVLSHLTGNDREAIESWRDAGRLSRAIAVEPVLLIGGLVSYIVHNIGLDGLGEIAPGIRIGDGGLSADETRQLIAEVLDDSFTRKAVAKGFRRERVGLCTGPYLTGLIGRSPWLLRPLLLDEARISAKMMGDIANDIEVPRVSPQVEPSEHQRIMMTVPQFTSTAAELVQHALRRRMLAAVLAIQLFHHERGRYPQRIEELVPDYLPAIPNDPRAAGLPMGYLLEEGGKRPVILMWGTEGTLKVNRTLARSVYRLPQSIHLWALIVVDASDWSDPAGSMQQPGDGEVKKSGTPGDKDQPEPKDKKN